MNNESHYYIAGKGFDLLPDQIRREWKNGRFFMLKTCMYPDIFADRSLSEEEKKKIDPDFDNAYLEPMPPKTAWYRELSRKIQETPSAWLSENIPEKRMYVHSYFLEKTVESLKNDDRESGKVCRSFFSLPGRHGTADSHCQCKDT